MLDSPTAPRIADPRSTARAALQAATRHLHVRVEGRIDLASSSLTLRSYTTTLQSFLRAYAALEDQLERHAQTLAQLGLVVADHRKAPLLRADLSALGMTIADRGPPMVPAMTVAGAIGAMYVMEGATLGGAVIRRNVRKVLGLDESSGAAFFALYGDAVGARWREFCVALERGLDDASRIQAAAEGAVATFGLIDTCIVEGA